MPLKLKAKTGVVWKVCPAIEEIQEAVAACFKEVGGVATVTSAKDSLHSEKSAHHQDPEDRTPAEAIDLRIWGLFPEVKDSKKWWRRVQSFTNKLVEALNQKAAKGKFYALLEKDHIHLEWANEKGPNIRGFRPGLFVYTTDFVKERMA